MLAFFWASYLLWKNFRLSSYREEDVFDSLFIGIFSGLFVARVVHVVTHFDKFGFDILKFILINGYPGLSLVGFIVGFLVALLVWFRRKKIKFYEGVSYFVTPAFVALGLGKIGSFFAGVETGGRTAFFLSLKYVGAAGKRHLTPLYEGIFFLIGAYIAYRILFAMRRQKYTTAFNFYFFIWYFSLVTFAFDFLKDRPIILYGQSLNSIVSLFLLLTFSLYFLYYFRSLIFKKRKVGGLFVKHGTHKGIHKATEGKTS